VEEKEELNKVNLDICKAPLNIIAFSKALKCGNAQFYLQTSHIPFFTPQPQSITVICVKVVMQGREEMRGVVHMIEE